jgi:hypothetical protein
MNKEKAPILARLGMAKFQKSGLLTRSKKAGPEDDDQGLDTSRDRDTCAGSSSLHLLSSVLASCALLDCCFWLRPIVISQRFPGSSKRGVRVGKRVLRSDSKEQGEFILTVTEFADWNKF